MNTTRADVDGDEPGDEPSDEPSESSRSSGAISDHFAVSKGNPDDLNMNITRVDVAGDEPGESSRSSAAISDHFAVRKGNPDDLNMNTTRVDVAGDEPGESSRSSGAISDYFDIRKENPDDRKVRQQAVSVAFNASGLSLDAFAEAHPDMIEKLLPERPPTPWYKIIEYVNTEEDLIKFKLKLYRAYLAQCSRVTPDERKNIEFLISYYENGGSLPPSGTMRWVRDGQFAPEGYSQTAAINRKNQTIDTGLKGWFQQHAS